MLPQYLRIKICVPRWRPVFSIVKGAKLLKVRDQVYRDITGATAKITSRFGCYSWGDSTTILYVGSFAQDYKHGNFKSNLQARVHNYLQNHRIRATGRKNTNLVVFEQINAPLQTDNVVLRFFEFDTLKMEDESFDFTGFSSDPDLVRLVENFLIARYRRRGQCPWNRH